MDLENMTRPNRSIHLSWKPVSGIKNVYSARTTINDSVFGGLVSRFTEDFKWTWQDDGSYLVAALTPEGSQMSKTLLSEAALLNPEELPEVLRIQQAWIYLDKGRAYGLEVGDRMIIKDGSQPIAGHVVGFYRPRGDLQTKRNTNVVEGAVVYIRDGQNLPCPLKNEVTRRHKYESPYLSKSQRKISGLHSPSLRALFESGSF